MPRKSRALWATAILSLAVGCRAPYDPVVIRFKGVDVRQSAFLKELEPLAAKGTDIADPAVKASAFDRFVEETVVAIAAAPALSPLSQDRAESERWLAANLPAATVSEEEAQNFYEAHPEVAQVEESVTLREILVATMQDARDVVRILGSDPNAFELLARTRSRSPHAQSGGVMGSFRRGELPPEIEGAAFSLAPGQVSGIVTTTFGYHVLRLEAKAAPQTRSFADSRPEIEARLSEVKARLRMKQLIDRLVSQAQVNYEAVTSR